MIPFPYVLRRRMMVPSVAARLPKEYQEVEYIQSSGTQYIDTGIKPDNNTTLVMDFFSKGSAADLYKSLFGARTYNDAQCFNIYAQPTSSLVQYGSGSGNSKTASIGFLSRHVYEMGNNSLKIDGLTVTTFSSAAFTVPHNILLFTVNDAGSADGRRAVGQMYSCKIYSSNVLQRDLVPCYRISDGVAGMYDLANGVFYGNVGTGSFTVGSAVNTPGAGSGTTPSTQATVQLTGTFTSNYSNVAVVIGGVTYDTSKTLTIPFGTTITLRVSINGAYTEGKPVKITIDGVTVASQSTTPEILTYNYTVNSSCTIESYVLYTVGPISVLSLKVTTQ